MLGPRLGALGALKRVRLACHSRSNTRGLVRSYTTEGLGPTSWGSRASGDQQASEHDTDGDGAWNAESVSQISDALSSHTASPHSTKVPNGLRVDADGVDRSKQSSNEPSERTSSEPDVNANQYPPKSGVAQNARPWSERGQRWTHNPDETMDRQRVDALSIYERQKRARTVSAQHHRHLMLHKKSIETLQQSVLPSDQAAAKSHLKALDSMDETRSLLMESLKADMAPEQYIFFEKALAQQQEYREARAAHWEAKAASATSRRPLKRGFGQRPANTRLRPESMEETKVDAARKWALMAKQQAARAAARAELEGATEEAKTAAQVLATTAALALKDFEDVRQEHVGRLSPSELRDIEVSEEDADGTSLSASEADELLATSGASQSFKRDGRFVSEVLGELSPSEFPVKPVKPPRDAPVGRLANNLQRVLFSPGVHYMRDPRTGVWNFPRGLYNIPKPEDFNFKSIPEYITASKDPELAKMAQGDGIKYAGSTSTLTASFSHVWFTLNGGHGVDIQKHTQTYAKEANLYTAGAQMPAAITLRPQSNGRYAVDQDGRYTTQDNILSEYGQILEKLLTTDQNEWWRSLKGAPEDAVPKQPPRESYAYSRGGSVLMRSQLDCQDNRLPGSGTFDIKTRACMPIRQDRANWVANSVYDISETLGHFATFEREVYDLSRSGMLKYCLQARIGDMDGIFVAYHNTARCFGFEYMPRKTLDERLFGSSDVGDQVFALCVGFFERAMDVATDLFPDQALSVVLYQAQSPKTAHELAKSGSSRDANELIVAVQPLEWEGEGEIPTRAIKIQMINNVDGKDVPTGVGLKFFSDKAGERRKQKWTVRYNIAITPDTEEGHVAARAIRANGVQRMLAMAALAVPEGKTADEMRGLEESESFVSDEAEVEETTEDAEGSSVKENKAAPPLMTKWVEPTARIRALRESTKYTAAAYERRAAGWNSEIQEMSATDPEPATRPEPYVINDHDWQPIVRREKKPTPEEMEAETQAAAAHLEETNKPRMVTEAYDGQPSESPKSTVVEVDAVRQGRDLPPHMRGQPAAYEEFR